MRDPKAYAELSKRFSSIVFSSENQVEISNLIAGLVEAHSGSVHDFASAIGVSSKTVFRWKSMKPGKPFPARKAVLAIKDLAGKETQKGRQNNQLERWKRFGEWLRERRQTKGLKQHEAAHRAGLASVQQWSRYECGVPASRDRIIVLAEAIGESRDEALKQGGFPVQDEKDISIHITDAMLNAEYDSSREVGAKPRMDNLRWLSNAQICLGIEFDYDLCILLLKKREE